MPIFSQKSAKEIRLSQEHKIQFHDTDGEIYQQWRKETLLKIQQLYPTHIEPYTRPEDTDLQITPYNGPHRQEYHIMDITDPEPQTKSQKIREQLVLNELS